MLSSELKSALSIIYEALPVEEVNWALTGDASLALQGTGVEAHNLDILTDHKCAYEVERRLKRFAMKHVEYAEDINSCSHFGMLSVNGVPSEIIGAPQVRSHEGDWELPAKVLQIRHFVEYEGMRLPVTTLEYEAKALRAAGDTETADLVENFLREKVGA